jgi:hypothetical protein
MAIVVYPLNNIDFTAEDVAIYNSTRTSGIYAGDDFAISLTGSDNTISIDVGLAWMHLSRFNGVAVALKSKTYVDMGIPNATYPRIDALVLQFDANKNSAELVSKQGTASSNPQPPSVSRTEALYELTLLHVLRSPGAPSITAADVTDLRLDEKYCGLMADSVTRVDTVAIDAQVTALIQKLREDLKAVQDQTYCASKEYVKENVSDGITQAIAIASIANSLDNSDFTQFIAQAGIGGKHGNQDYAGDRWILDSGTVTGDAREDGNGYTNIKLNGTIRQIVANPPAVGSVFVEMISGTATATYQSGEVTITSSGGVIKNVLLCEGQYTETNKPAYQPKGYTAEMLECMRYYVYLGDVGLCGIAHAYSTTQAYCTIFLPVKMRIDPTIEHSKLTVAHSTYSSSFKKITGISTVKIGANIVTAWITTSGLTAGNDYNIWSDGASLSADL